MYRQGHFIKSSRAIICDASLRMFLRLSLLHKAKPVPTCTHTQALELCHRMGDHPHRPCTMRSVHRPTTLRCPVSRASMSCHKDHRSEIPCHRMGHGLWCPQDHSAHRLLHHNIHRPCTQGVHPRQGYHMPLDRRRRLHASQVYNATPFGKVWLLAGIRSCSSGIRLCSAYDQQQHKPPQHPLPSRGRGACLCHVFV